MEIILYIDGVKTKLTKVQLKPLGIVEKPIATLSDDGKIAKIGDNNARKELKVIGDKK